MDKFFKPTLFSLLLLLSISHRVFSQNFPVDCRVLLSPPLSGQLSEVLNSPLKFRVQLLLKDLTKPSVSVSLQIRLKGQGVWLQNPEGFLASQPITLTPGIPKTLSAVELGEYFSPQNIEAQGIDYQQLLNGLSLPFGFYEWEVIAIEQDRFRQVSNTATAKFFVQNNYPPILNMPANGSIVPTTMPQNILFSWTPRHQSPPLGRGGLVYELYLYEIPDASINSAADIQALINSGTPYMQELLSDKPNFIYGPTGLPLTVGSRYAWQVRAVSLDGETGFFNNGYSDIKSFVYGHLPCPQPSNLVAKVDADEGSVQLSWDAPTDALSYKLAFYTLPNGMKTEKSVLEPTFLLLQQPQGYQYRWEVKSVCQQGQSRALASEFELTKPTQQEAWISDPNLTYTPNRPTEPEPEVMQTTDNEGITKTKETDPEVDIDALLNTPTKIYIPADGKALPEGLPEPIESLPPNATVEQLQAALKTLKPTCAGIVSEYSCGNHDTAPAYSGEIISVNAGDEIAMNSMVLSVVSIDGSGNGEGLIKVPMMNNIKLGVTLSGIKVAEGGCVVAGKAELSGVSASILTDKQRVSLEKAYTAYNQILDVAYENAGAIAETYNTFTEKLAGIQKKATDLASKLNGGGKASKAEVEALKQLTQQATAQMQTTLDAMKKAYGEQINKEMAAQLETIINQNKAKTAELSNFKADNPTAIAGAVQSLANTKPAETEKIIKALPALMVEYAGKPYGNGKTISVDYSTFGKTFYLKNGTDNAETTWLVKSGEEIIKSFTGNLTAIDIDFTELDAEKLEVYHKTGMYFEVTQGERKVKVMVSTQKLVLEKLNIEDAKHPSRKATNGQTLYLVGEGKINANVSATGFKNPFTNPNLSWSFIKEGQSNPQTQFATKSNITYDFKANPVGVNERTYEIEAQNAVGDDKSVKVAVVDESRLKIEITNKLSPLLNVFNSINYWSKEFKTFGIPCSISILNNLESVIKQQELEFAYQTYNEEINGSRLFNSANEFEFEAKGMEILNLSCGKDLTIEVPMTSYKLNIASANIGVVAGLKGNVNIKRTKTVETNKISYAESLASGGGYIEPSISTSLLGVEGKAELEAGVKFIYPYQGNKSQFAIRVYTDDFIGKVIVSKDVSIFVTRDFSYEIFRLPTKKESPPIIFNINNF